MTLNLFVDPLEPPPTQDLSLILAQNNNGVPGSSLGSFTTETPSSGDRSYSPTGTITLAPNTTYWLVAGYPVNDVVYWTYTTDVSQTGGSGWSIGDDSYTFNDPNWEVLGDDVPVLLGVNATPVPEPSTYAMIAGFSLVGFAGWRRWCSRA